MPIVGFALDHHQTDNRTMSIIPPTNTKRRTLKPKPFFRSIRPFPPRHFYFPRGCMPRKIASNCQSDKPGSLAMVISDAPVRLLTG